MSWQEIARQVAPTLAAGLLGPMGGVVARIAAEALFPDDPATKAAATPQAIAERIATMASPADVERLRRAELEVRKFEAETKIRFAELEQRSMDGARAMRSTAMASGNRTADHLSWAVIASFLLIALTVLVGCGLAIGGVLRVSNEDKEIWIAVSGLVGAIVGYFSANAQQVVGFYFGSSLGSATKTDQIAQQTTDALAALGRTASKSEVEFVTRPEPPRGAPAAAAGGSKEVVEDLAARRAQRAQAAPAASTAEVNARWDACIAFVLEREGGFVNDPDDAGGATNMGITLRTLADWRGEEVTAEDVQALTEEEARAIYRARYWNVVRCDALPAGIDLMTFDAAVLHGPAQAVRFLQRAAGLAGADLDGVAGPQTLGAVRRVGAPRLIEDVARQRADFFDQVVARRPASAKFLKGWTNRLAKARERALAMAKLATQAAAA